MLIKWTPPWHIVLLLWYYFLHFNQRQSHHYHLPISRPHTHTFTLPGKVREMPSRFPYSCNLKRWSIIMFIILFWETGYKGEVCMLCLLTHWFSALSVAWRSALRMISVHLKTPIKLSCVFHIQYTWSGISHANTLNYPAWISTGSQACSVSGAEGCNL